MLEAAFYETQDYRSLLASTERPIVVGRRGTGKTALCTQLDKFWRSDSANVVFTLIPEEDQVFGLREKIGVFGTKYTQLKAGSKMAWKYAILAEIATSLVSLGKLSATDLTQTIPLVARRWRKFGQTFTSRVNSLLKDPAIAQKTPEGTIGGFAQHLGLVELQAEVGKALQKARVNYIFLIDQLDEGFEPDERGVGLIGGFVHAAVDLNAQLSNTRTNIFLRDNIFRALASMDPDYSKNIEGRFLRLHWDENQLFDLVCNRIRVGFGIDEDSNRRIWNSVTSDSLQERSGFEKCLRQTLYRPRDLLSLLNDAFYNASKQKRDTLILADVESTAREISITRLDDLIKEYAAIIPTLKPLVYAFKETPPEHTYKDIINRLEALYSDQTVSGVYQREFALMEGAQEGVRTLYSVGFLGTKDAESSTFVFCHDGRTPSRDFRPDDRLLIHPCYWMALDLTKNGLDSEGAASIHDEYEVEVYSEAPEIRRKRIGQLLAKLDKIPVGTEGAVELEEWCLKAVRICFSGPLRNIDLHPNKDASQRRDIVASNQSEKGVWRRVLDTYGSRQVIFEIKNKLGVDPDEFRQMLSYLHGEYGRIGFIITRDKKPELYSGPELEWTRELFNTKNVIVVKLTANYLGSLLSKMRSPGREDPCEQSINNLLDKYTRIYLTNAKLPRPS